MGAKAERTYLNDPALHAMIFSLVVDGQLASHLSVPRKTIVHCGAPYKACGLSGMLTVPAFRGKGYGRQVVRAATAFMEQDGADIGLFTCGSSIASVLRALRLEAAGGNIAHRRDAREPVS